MNKDLSIKLKYGRGFKEVLIPEDNVMDILMPEDLPTVDDQLQEVKRALQEPIGALPLIKLAEGKKNVVILCSDITRPSPSHLLVPPILDELNKAGVSDSDITIIFGLGYHRPHTQQEQMKLVGDAVYKRVRCIDHDREKCVFIGTSSKGTPIWVFEPVTKADLLIGTGNLEFHYFAGYSAGDKALMPAVCSKETVQANHAMLFDPRARSGIIDGNPIREDIEEIGRIAGVEFIVNVVLNSKNEIVKCTAGDPIKAHRAGCVYVDKMYKRSIPYKADIVICSAGGHPKDINLYQAQKAFENASYAVREGGVIILAASCTEQLGEKTFTEWMQRAESLDDPINWIQDEFVLGAHKAAVICKVLKSVQAFLITDMPEVLVKKCFFEPASTIEEALQKAIERIGPQARILVMPYANSTVPHLLEA